MGIRFRHGFTLYVARLRTDTNGPVYIADSDSRVATREIERARLYRNVISADVALTQAVKAELQDRTTTDSTAAVVEIECSYCRNAIISPEPKP